MAARLAAAALAGAVMRWAAKKAAPNDDSQNCHCNRVGLSHSLSRHITAFERRTCLTDQLAKFAREKFEPLISPLASGFASSALHAPVWEQECPSFGPGDVPDQDASGRQRSCSQVCHRHQRTSCPAENPNVNRRACPVWARP